MQSGATPGAKDYFADAKAPTAEELSYQLQQLVEQGSLTPEQAQAALAEQSAMAGVSTDPNMKQAQMEALQGLQDISSNGGMTTMDQANLSKIANEEATRSRGAREAILQNAQARGMGGSGMEIMAQLQNQQDSVTRQSQRDLDVAGMAQQRALEALMQGGQMAGQMQNQDFNQQAQKAQAQDAISRFNAQNQQQANLTNTAANNSAQAANLNNKQNVANANVGIRNDQAAQKGKNLQQAFDNKLKLATGRQGVEEFNTKNMGQNSRDQADATNKNWSMVMDGFKGAMGGMKDGGLVEGEPSSHDSEPRMLQPGEFVVRKDDVPEMLEKMHTDEDGNFDAASFLDSITGHKYKFGKGK